MNTASVSALLNTAAGQAECMEIAERTATWRRERRVLFRDVAGGMAAGARLEQAGRERSRAFLIALVAGLIWGTLSGFGVPATMYFHRFWLLVCSANKH